MRIGRHFGQCVASIPGCGAIAHRCRSYAEGFKKSRELQPSRHRAFALPFHQPYSPFRPRAKGRQCCVSHPSPVPVFVHIHYPDLIPELVASLSILPGEIHLYATFSPQVSRGSMEPLRACARESHVLPCENRGRDIRPFLASLAEYASEIRSRNYLCGLKLHTKKSPHLTCGDAWRQYLFSELCENASECLDAFAGSPRVGLIGPKGHLLRQELHAAANEKHLSHASQALLDSPHAYRRSKAFVAGSMFWFRVEPLVDLATQAMNRLGGLFEDEKGQYDGTAAHAFERFFGVWISAANLTVQDTNGNQTPWKGIHLC